ncbi:oleate hydratase, partial [Staphylococcus aureus]|uniref:oleate hydratase n=1 Tax=Staphylococcus aureus TaxID=1280 RepID=UPI00164366E7
TTNNKHIIHTIQTISKPDPLPPKTVTPPIITINHSPSQITFTINPHQHFKHQPKNQISTSIYPLYSHLNPHYIKNPIIQSTPNQICQQ